MNNKTYIRKSVKGYYISLDNELPATAYEIGSTYQDFLDNKWMLLSEEQVAFHVENPTASVKEVLDMQLTPVPERTLAQAKSEKIAAINSYDSSDAVNGFNIINGEDTIIAWLTPSERANYRSSIDAAELVGVENLQLYVGEMPVTLPTQSAKMMLAQIQLYADQCFIVTKQHIAAVAALETIEAVDAYDNTVDYPSKPEFNLTNE